jgi:hypothetical protein
MAKKETEYKTCKIVAPETNLSSPKSINNEVAECSFALNTRTARAPDIAKSQCQLRDLTNIPLQLDKAAGF